jgi:glycosyltransferase involved in cell wall biosynthesis
MISYLPDADRGGQVNLLRLVRGLDADRFRCLVLVPGKGTMAEEAKAAGGNVEQLRLYHPLNHPLRGSLSVLRLRAILRRYQPQILYVDGADHVYAAALAARGLRTRVIWHLQTSFETRYDVSNLGRVHATVCCADHIHERLRKLNPLAQISTIYNAVDTTRFFPGQAPDLRAALSAAPEHFVFLYVGGLTTLKGTDDLVAAFARVFATNRLARLWIVGDGADRKQLQAACAAAHITDAVKMLGVRADVEHLMRAADCFVFPTHAEGLPLTLLEAIVSGCPIIATDIPGNTQVLSRDAAIFIPPKEPGALAQAMLDIAQFPSIREQLRARARSLLKPHFLLPHYINAFAQLFVEQASCLSPLSSPPSTAHT